MTPSADRPLPRVGDRWQFATFVDRPVHDRLDFFADLLFYRARTRSGRPSRLAK